MSFLSEIEQDFRLRLRLYGDNQKRRRKSGVSSSPFYPRLDERFQEENLHAYGDARV